MNCIFITVFNQEKYVEMFLLLLESILHYGNLDSNTEILIYTSTPFMQLIKQSRLFNDKIVFEINDNVNTITGSCKARLDLFHLSSITKYNKILYLDTDIIVKDGINSLFNICNEDILYVLEEGFIDNPADHYGKKLFGGEIHNYIDQTAFTSGILLFNNCAIIKDLFTKIQQDIIDRPYDFGCHDQPYIVYNAFKYNLYNNKILKAFVVNNDNNIHSNKIIHHFPGRPGVYQHKIDQMTCFLNDIKLVYERLINIDLTNSNVIDIYDDIWTCSSKMRQDIADFFATKRHFKIAEIGSHKGYSTKVLSKIFSKVYAVDNNTEWTNFNREFNKEITNIEYVMLDIYNNSWNILPHDIEVSFIDADHSYYGCRSDLMNSINHFKNLQYIILDDYGVWPGVKQIVDELVSSGNLVIEKFIGITDVPGPNGIVTNVNEGVICSVRRH